ncbi:hypothetical protein BDV3_001343 [Batrachochytrium dendrobatidis]
MSKPTRTNTVSYGAHCSHLDGTTAASSSTNHPSSMSGETDLGRSNSMSTGRRSNRASSVSHRQHQGAPLLSPTASNTIQPLSPGIPELYLQQLQAHHKQTQQPQASIGRLASIFSHAGRSSNSHKSRRSISVPLNLHISETLATLEESSNPINPNQHHLHPQQNSQLHKSPIPASDQLLLHHHSISGHRRHESAEMSTLKSPQLIRPPVNVAGPFTAFAVAESAPSVLVASMLASDASTLPKANKLSSCLTDQEDLNASIPCTRPQNDPVELPDVEKPLPTFLDNPKFDLTAFMEQDVPILGPEPIPKLFINASIRSPIFTAQTDLHMIPHLIDAVVGSLPPDAWDWASLEVDHSNRDDAFCTDALSVVEQAKPAPTLESVLTKDKRGHVVLNLWETEQNYTNQLGIIQKCFQERLSKRNIISDTANNFIFAGTADLYTLHQKFFYRLCDVVNVDNWSTTESKIGALFLDMKDEFVRLYTRFIDNYAISQKSMKKEEKSNEDYQNFMKEAAKLRETNRQTLKDYLILPVQRTTRYHILLKDLCKCTPFEHPDRKDLEKAWEAMNNLAAMVNEKKRREEEATGLFDAFESTKHCPPQLISHKRRLIMRVEASERTSKRDVQLVLCSDSLMITVPARGGVLGFRSANEHPYRFVRWHHILELDISDSSLDDSPTVTKDSIRITIDINKRPPNPDPQVVSTHTSEITPKELSINVLSLMFVGPDAAKNQLSFRLAIHGEMKAFREAQAMSVAVVGRSATTTQQVNPTVTHAHVHSPRAASANASSTASSSSHRFRS